MLKDLDGEFFLPVYIHSDDWESSNALESHASDNKFGAVYDSIGCLPPKDAYNLRYTVLV